VQLTSGKSSKYRGRIVMFATLACLIVLTSLPVWWFGSGRDMQTIHDGLSTSFRQSLADILSLDGFAAKNGAYVDSRTVSSRVDLI
jgi:hypothetical protein